jgi:hypothetical protein
MTERENITWAVGIEDAHSTHHADRHVVQVRAPQPRANGTFDRYGVYVATPGIDRCSQGGLEMLSDLLDDLMERALDAASRQTIQGLLDEIAVRIAAIQAREGMEHLQLSEGATVAVEPARLRHT